MWGLIFANFQYSRCSIFANYNYWFLLISLQISQKNQNLRKFSYVQYIGDDVVIFNWGTVSFEDVICLCPGFMHVFVRHFYSFKRGLDPDCVKGNDLFLLLTNVYMLRNLINILICMFYFAPIYVYLEYKIFFDSYLAVQNSMNNSK